jgi:hypothetical protein
MVIWGSEGLKKDTISDGFILCRRGIRHCTAYIVLYFSVSELNGDGAD